MRLIDPRNERTGAPPQPAPRLTSFAGKTIGLLDISKPGGNVFLDRLEMLLHQRSAKTLRVMKPTFAKPAPPDILEALRSADAVIEALAD